MYQIVFNDGNWVKGERKLIDAMADSFNTKTMLVKDASPALKDAIGNKISIRLNDVRYFGKIK